MVERDNFLWKTFGGNSRQETNDQIMPRVERREGGGEVLQVHFLVI